MKIAICSDSHNNWEKLESCVNRANQEQCDFLFFAGDLVNPEGLKILEKFNNTVHFIIGNNETELNKLKTYSENSKNLKFHLDFFDDKIAEHKIYMTHYPSKAEIIALNNTHNLVIYGHTHTYKIDKVIDTYLINPGEIQGKRSGESSFIIATLGNPINFLKVYL